ncbi:hypothetical protein KAR91_60245, partial [Candidatus Pacearchaeota archaeon]|nr:hypothetical protein [Candidatus Pacearchaeota archaeon]
LDATDTNTEGQLVLIVEDSAEALPVRHEYNVMAEAAWDSLYVAKDDGFMDVNIKTVGRADTQETEANNLEAACAAYSVTRGLTGTAVPAAAADAAGGLMISDDGAWDADELYDAIVTDAAGTNIAVDIIAVKAETAEIVTDTGTTLDTLIKDIPTTTEFELRTILAAVYTVVGDLGTVQSADNDTKLTSLLALLDDARTEPGDTAPPVNPDMATKIDYLYKFLRNKISTSATRIDVYDDAGTNIDHSSTISDDGTDFVRGEFGVGA